MHNNIVETDIVIIGGGIAGLWLLNRLRQQGFSTILLESNALGGGQTHQAQGIIHGGIKYALHGALSSASEAIAEMPTLWKNCLKGEGEIDLSNVSVLSSKHYLWTTGGIASKLSGFFAELAFKQSLQCIDKNDYPLCFQNPLFQGQVYALNELVLDMVTLVRELVKNHQDAIFKIEPMKAEHFHWNETGQLQSLTIHASPFPALKIKAQQYIFTAGRGNELIISQLKQIKNISLETQRRPLQMVAVKHPNLYPLYAHCIGLRAVPRITITTHTAQDGKRVWYLGGQLAEEGVKRSQDQQIAMAKQELHALFPWIDFNDAEYYAFHVDRAEPFQANGKRPDSFFIENIENCMVAWPTKLALTPLLANAVLQLLTNKPVVPRFSNAHELRAWPMPAFARPIWDIA